MKRTWSLMTIDAERSRLLIEDPDSFWKSAEAKHPAERLLESEASK